MIIAQHISTQFVEFSIMFACGLALAVFFEIYNNNAQSFIGDIIFMTFAGLFTAAFWYYSSYGRISIHETAALLAGIFVWKKFFKGQISNCIGHIYVIIIVLIYAFYL